MESYKSTSSNCLAINQATEGYINSVIQKVWAKDILKDEANHNTQSQVNTKNKDLNGVKSSTRVLEGTNFNWEKPDDRNTSFKDHKEDKIANK